eukprot:697713-Hanusia_phi.AAC.1
MSTMRALPLWGLASWKAFRRGKIRTCAPDCRLVMIAFDIYFESLVRLDVVVKLGLSQKISFGWDRSAASLFVWVSLIDQYP